MSRIIRNPKSLEKTVVGLASVECKQYKEGVISDPLSQSQPEKIFHLKFNFAFLDF